jgi:hypothetical protein
LLLQTKWNTGFSRRCNVFITILQVAHGSEGGFHLMKSKKRILTQILAVSFFFEKCCWGQWGAFQLGVHVNSYCKRSRQRSWRRRRYKIEKELPWDRYRCLLYTQ